MKLSVVIPTRDRHESLSRLLASLAVQERPADEIIVVTGSRDRQAIQTLATTDDGMEVVVAETEASVCIQRNAGIRLATGDYVCLCDDDIELPPDYFASLIRYIEMTADAHAVSGLLVQRDDHGKWQSQYPPVTVSELGWCFVSQQTVWGDLNSIPLTGWVGKFARAMSAFYRRRGNTHTLAGWPLVTDLAGEVFRTSVYGLGACIVLRDWLLNAPYDEVLDPHGIGDNFGVASEFPQECPIHVLTGVEVIHHHDPADRIATAIAHTRRVVALDYFLKRNARFTVLNRLWLRWSTFGFVLAGILQRDWQTAGLNVRLLGRLCLRPNPYFTGSAAGLRRMKID